MVDKSNMNGTANGPSTFSSARKALPPLSSFLLAAMRRVSGPNLMEEDIEAEEGSSKASLAAYLTRVTGHLLRWLYHALRATV